jgi:hypothetical protein
MVTEQTFFRAGQAHDPALRQLPIPPGQQADPPWLRSRAELRQAIRRLTRAVSAPADEPAWSRRLRSRLAALRAQLTEHIVVTEGPGGLYAELLEHAPRLTRPVASLVADHEALLTQVDTLADRLHQPGADTEAVRRSAGELLDALARHRQRGADLVYEAHATDLGGET